MAIYVLHGEERFAVHVAHLVDGDDILVLQAAARLEFLVLDLTEVEDSEISGIKVLHFIAHELAESHGFGVAFVGLQEKVRRRIRRFFEGEEMTFTFAPGSEVLQIAEVEHSTDVACAGPLDSCSHFFGAFQVPPVRARVVSERATVAVLSYAAFAELPIGVQRMLQNYTTKKMYSANAFVNTR